MELINEYGPKRERREKDRKKLELKYLEGLLVLQNEEVEEWLEICNRIHKGEPCAYSLNHSIMELGKQTKERDRLVIEIKKIKLVDLDEDEYI